IKYLRLVIIGILAMELLQSIRVGVHALSVVDLVGISVEHCDCLYVIALAWRFPADSLGFFDCGLPLQCHWARPSPVQTSDGRSSQTPIGHGAVGIFPGNVRKGFSSGGKREGMQHRKSQIELFLDLRLASDWEMHHSKM